MNKFNTLLLQTGIIFIFIAIVGCNKDDNTETPPDQTNGTFTDTRDGNLYSYSKIGDQIWMTENLTYKANQGCLAYDNDESIAEDYGYLYDWETAVNICPDGWHLPTDPEWQELIEYLGGEEVAGGKMKEEGTSHWGAPNTGATNSSGFTGLPGGNYSIYGFQGLNGGGHFWSSTPLNNAAKSYSLYYDHITIGYGVSSSKDVGSSIRCVKNDK